MHTTHGAGNSRGAEYVETSSPIILGTSLASEAARLLAGWNGSYTGSSAGLRAAKKWTTSSNTNVNNNKQHKVVFNEPSGMVASISGSSVFLNTAVTKSLPVWREFMTKRHFVAYICLITQRRLFYALVCHVYKKVQRHQSLLEPALSIFWCGSEQMKLAIRSQMSMLSRLTC